MIPVEKDLESFEDNINFLIANLMEFYKGSISYDRFQHMGIIEIYELTEHANRITAEREKKR